MSPWPSKEGTIVLVGRTMSDLDLNRLVLGLPSCHEQYLVKGNIFVCHGIGKGLKIPKIPKLGSTSAKERKLLRQGPSKTSTGKDRYWKAHSFFFRRNLSSLSLSLSLPLSLCLFSLSLVESDSLSFFLLLSQTLSLSLSQSLFSHCL